VARRFLDTNVLVYTDDGGDRRRARLALAAVQEAIESREGVLSTQVLQEYFSVTTRKLGTDPAVARRKVQLFATLEVVQVDVELILGAVDLHRLHAISFWDALILQAAGRAGCEVLLTEDLQAGRAISGLRIVDPFA
jgi:predicted nucleic acid-binding protein